MDHENIEHETMRMCILGGGGYLVPLFVKVVLTGQSLAKALQKTGHFVVLLDLKFESFPHIVLNSSKLQRVQGSILDTDKLREALTGCSVCFHLVGYGMSGGSSLNRRMTFLINYEGTKSVIAECKNLGIQRLIYSSSIAVVYDGNETNFADETMPYSSKFANPYAESKCLAEKAILAASRLSISNCNPIQQCSTTTENGNGLSTCALRFRGIYGPGELRTTQRTVNLCLNGLVMAKFKKFNKESRTQYSGIENCISALMLAETSLRNQDSPALAQVYNIVDGGEPVDTFDFWKPLIEGVGAKMPRLVVPFPLIQVFAYFLELLYHIFGIEPLFTKFEAELMAINNTFSIEKAKRDLGYSPINNHDLGSTVQFFTQQQLQLQILNSEISEEKPTTSTIAAHNNISLHALLNKIMTNFTTKSSFNWTTWHPIQNGFIILLISVVFFSVFFGKI